MRPISIVVLGGFKDFVQEPERTWHIPGTVTMRTVKIYFFKKSQSKVKTEVKVKTE